MTRLLIVLCLLSGCCAAPSAMRAVDAHADRLPGRVILFRGAYFGLFSQGLDGVAESLRKEGINATVLPHHAWQRVAEEVPPGRPFSPLILIGHSIGADAAVRLAGDLGRSGENVALLITLDPVFPPKVPPNVRQCWNVYQASPGTFNPPWFKGRALAAEVQSHPMIENDNLWNDGNDWRQRRLSHWNITQQPMLQQKIVHRILSLYQPHD